jgi:hypothetical protein
MSSIANNRDMWYPDWEEGKVRLGLVTKTRLSYFAASCLQPLFLGLLTPLTSSSLIRHPITAAGGQDLSRAAPPR